jgi:ABC-type dipeptide/oligopeptide/nickel transport system ATPase component
VEAVRGASLEVAEGEVVGQVASRVAVMRAGQIVETGPSAWLLNAPSILIRAACSPPCRRCAPTAAGRWRW